MPPYNGNGAKRDFSKCSERRWISIHVSLCSEERAWLSIFIIALCIPSILLIVCSDAQAEITSSWPQWGYDSNNTRRAYIHGEFDFNDISEVWNGTIDDEVIASGIIASDVTGDSYPEIIFGTKSGNILVLSTSTGEVLGAMKVSNRALRSTPVASDFDLDGITELVFGTVDGEIKCIEWYSQKVEWTIVIGSGMDCSATLADVVGDKRPEIFIGAYNGTMYCITPEGDIAWEYPTGYHMSNTSAAIGDIYGNGSLACVFDTGYIEWGSTGGPPSPYVYYLDAATGEILGRYHSRGWASSQVLLADIDGDGILETIIDDDRVVAIKGINDSVLWSFNGEEAGSRFYKSFACGFFNNSTTPSIIATSGLFDNVVALFDGPTGHMTELRGLKQPPVCLADMDGDGHDDVITSISILHGDNLKGITRLGGAWRWNSGLVVVDLDLDGYAEICRVTPVDNGTWVTAWDSLFRQEFTAKIMTPDGEPAVFYAGLNDPMNLTIDIGNVTSRSEIASIEIIIDPDDVRGRFIADVPNATVHTDLITYSIILHESDILLKDGIYRIILSLSFNWSFEPVDNLSIFIDVHTRRPGIKQFFLPEVLRVEHGVVLIGDPELVGEVHGAIPPHGWCFPQEKLELTGLRLVYRGTDALVPPVEAGQVLVKDSEGRQWRILMTIDGAIVLKLEAPGFDVESLVLRASPAPEVAGAVGYGSKEFLLGVDGTPPRATDVFPGDEWFGVERLVVGLVVEDGNGSGPDAGSVRYQLILPGSTPAEDWTSPMSIGLDPPRLVVRTWLDLPDGISTLSWRVEDLAGNVATYGPFLLHMDTGNLTFRNPLPIFWVTTTTPKVSIEAVEVGGSLIDGSSVNYSVSTSGLGGFGPWMRTSMYKSNRTVRLEEVMSLAEGPDNWVMWRASDLAGHMLVSSPQQVLVDTQPPLITDVRPGPTQVRDGPLVELEAHIVDPLSKVDPSTVSVAISLGDADVNPMALTWTAISNVTALGDVLECVFMTEMPEGCENYVFWRAMDRAGNGFHVSGPHRVWMNGRPEISDVLPEEEDVVFKGDRLSLAIEASDPDSDPLDVRWYVDGMEIAGSGLDAEHLVNRTGDLSIKVVVTDGHNHSVSRAWTVQAIERPSPRPDTFLLAFLLLVIILVLVVVLLYHRYRKMRGTRT